MDFYEEMIELMALFETWMKASGVSEKQISEYRAAFHSTKRAEQQGSVEEWRLANPE